MEVCVNLTSPPQDILEEYVVVNVFNNESSVYIPDGAEIASMLNFHALMEVSNLNCNYSFQLQMFLIVVREVTQWLHGLTIRSRQGVEISLGTHASMQQEELSAITNPSTMMSV